MPQLLADDCSDFCSVTMVILWFGAVALVFVSALKHRDSVLGALDDVNDGGMQ